MTAFRHRHARAEIALFLTAGFAFDVATLDRIDNWKILAQQGAFLGLLGVLLSFEQRYRLGGGVPPRGLGWLLRFHQLGAHFLVGSLLSAFALFFFKSASGFAGFAFMAAIFALLVVNELPRFQRLGPLVRYGLYSLALSAYLAYLLPVLAGRLEAWLFVVASVLSLLPLGLLYLHARRWSGSAKVALKQVAAPAGVVQVALLSLYFAGAIPPVPLSLQYIGIFHEVKSEQGTYQLLHEREPWRFWHRGDQHFLHRPGDKVFVFASVFAPMSVQKGNLPIHFHWFHRHPEKGWVPQGAWTYGGLTGGRAEGFRVFATRSDPRPGSWRVEIRSPDGREIGRIGFEVVQDVREEERVFQIQQG